ncbi:MAG: polyphosphate kinase 1 [Acidimicrobiia bacterium]|nr:polyphosphate kinase 1 [Acidimicrobiia bacterium]
MTSRFFNRELSLLDFQERVLAIAENPNVPLLERLKFVAIVSSNLDEFFQVRVAGLMEQHAAGLGKVTPDGRTPGEQLAEIRGRAEQLLARTERVFLAELRPALAEHGIHIARWDDLDEADRKELVARFEAEIYPVLTPLAFDPAHPFPFISNLSLNLAVIVRNPKTGASQFARVKVPPLLPRFLAAGEDGATFVPVEEVIASQLESLFPGMEITGAHPFRVTRSAEQAVEEEEADDLLAAMEELLHTRHRFSRLVRLEIDPTMPEEILELLREEMDLDDTGVYVSRAVVGLGGLWSIYGLDRPDLKDDPWTPITQPILGKGHLETSLFDRIRERDVLVHMPYDAFGTSVGAFIAEAASDPDVMAIKQTLYRTSDPEDPAVGGEASIVRSLIRAAHEGKQVVVLVELKARFDEEANITWARLLEEAGVHVVYGVAGLKTHAKIALVVRRERGGLRRYSHIGTGNYNPKTARIYEDFGLFTADDEIGADLTELFNVLTGYSRQRKYRKLLVAPTTLRKQMMRRIEAQSRPGGRIVWKLNHLVDPDIIEALYRASGEGAEIDLIVRGVCCLRPGVEGMSERIRVRSIVGEFLEHSRIYRFGEGSDAEYLMGSADMMQRNLNGRVESITPIEDDRLRARLEEVLQITLSDDSLAWELRPDGTWSKVTTTTGMHTHARLKSVARARAHGAAPDPRRAVETTDVVVAAGGIVERSSDDHREVLLVHRPAYDDWSFPKGKLHEGETEADAAAREVLEETGHRCTLGPEVGIIEYVDRTGNRKVVRYWLMRAVDGAFTPNEEVDEVRWLTPTDALDLLSYDRDRALLRSVTEGGVA